MHPQLDALYSPQQTWSETWQGLTWTFELQKQHDSALCTSGMFRSELFTLLCVSQAFPSSTFTCIDTVPVQGRDFMLQMCWNCRTCQSCRTWTPEVLPKKVFSNNISDIGQMRRIWRYFAQFLFPRGVSDSNVKEQPNTAISQSTEKWISCWAPLTRNHL